MASGTAYKMTVRNKQGLITAETRVFPFTFDGRMQLKNMMEHIAIIKGHGTVVRGYRVAGIFMDAQWYCANWHGEILMANREQTRQRSTPTLNLLYKLVHDQCSS